MKYQQGDVVLTKVSREEFNKLNLKENINMTTETRFELAYGEETGHCHAIYLDEMLEGAGVTLFKKGWGNTNEGLIVSNEPVTIKHEEHNPVTLPTGYYVQCIVKEYDPLSRTVRGVVD